MIIILLYIAFYVFALMAENTVGDNRKRLLMLTCLVLAILAGIRDRSWNDTGVYIMGFEEYTPSLSDLSFLDQPFGYAEKGFFFLGVIVKSFSDSVTAYLLFVSFITFFFLYKVINKYCYYPFLGVCAYVSRFYLNRNFMQIRAGLSYAIILIGIQYITKRDWKRYFAIVFIAYLFHHSALIAVPLYFICMVNIKKFHIVLGIFAAFFVAYFYSGFIRSIIGENASDLNVDTYVTDQYTREYGLLNPMIYFQLFLLMVYTFSEKRMRLTTEHYYVIRNAYFYSTLILITFSTYTALSGRTSSLFATMEMVIIPSIALAFFKRDRWIAFLGMGIALAAIFFMNWLRR